MRIVGVIGGMGPLAGVDFVRRLVEQTDATCDQDHPRVILDSDPSVPDRSAAMLGVGPDPFPVLVERARGLAEMGADLLVMPCNSAQAFLPRLRDEVTTAAGWRTVEWIDWVDVVVADIVRRQPRRVLVLATEGTISTGLYRRPLEAAGIEVVEHDCQGRVDATIRAIKAGKAVDLWALTRKRSDETVLVGCTDLSAALPPAGSRFWPRWLADASQTVAGHVAWLARS